MICTHEKYMTFEMFKFKCRGVLNRFDREKLMESFCEDCGENISNLYLVRKTVIVELSSHQSYF